MVTHKKKDCPLLHPRHINEELVSGKQEVGFLIYTAYPTSQARLPMDQET